MLLRREIDFYMKFYVFTLNMDLNLQSIISTKNIYSTTEFDLAQIKYDYISGTMKDTEVAYLVADFGICKEYKYNHVTFARPVAMYMPFFVIECSDKSLFNYLDIFDLKDVKIVLMNDGIHQMFDTPTTAFEKFEYYKNNRIASTLAIQYTDNFGCNQLIPVSSVECILFKETRNYIEKFVLKPLPGDYKLSLREIAKKRVQC